MPPSLPSVFDRRGFWQHLTALSPNSTGEHLPEFFLDDLSKLPLEEVLPLIPLLTQDVRIEVDGWRLMAHRANAEPVVLGAWLPAEAWLLNHFDGVRTLEALAATLSRQTGWPLLTAQEFSRAFFIRLTALNIALPGNCPLESP